MPSDSRSAERRPAAHMRVRGRVRSATAVYTLVMLLATGAGADPAEVRLRPGARLSLSGTSTARRDWVRSPFFGLFRPTDSKPEANPPGSGLLAALHIEFADAASCRRFSPKGATVFHRFQRFAGVMVPVEQLSAVLDSAQRAPGFRALEDDDLFRIPPPPRARPTAISKAIPESIVRGGVAGRTGRGTLIGIIDSGVDFRNADLVAESPDGPRSRIAAYWDASLPYDPARGMGRPGPIRFPSGRPVGTVFTGAELTRALREKLLPEMADRVGHGTACAGVAAGNGRNLAGALEVRGVAPQAELLVVRAQVADDMPGLTNFLVAPAVAWMSSIADSMRRPLVMSCSFGSQTGMHDGSRVIERELDALLPDAAVGRALVVAAGNEGATAIHARMPLGEKLKLLSWKCDAEVALLELHVLARELDQIEVYEAERTDGRTYELDLYPLVPIAPASPWRIIRFEVRGPVGGLFLRSSVPGTVVEAYLVGGQFDSEFASQTGTVASPGMCRAAITAGSYDWNDAFAHQGLGLMTIPDPCSQRPIAIGSLSCYSSRGDSRVATVKPDLAAPGQWFAAPVSFAGGVQPAGLTPMTSGGFEGLHESGRYRLFNGTSAAAPYTAGVIALAFERSPRMTLGEVRRRLLASLTQDAATGGVPNPAWGHGKLDLAAAKRFLTASTSMRVPGRPSVRSPRAKTSPSMR